MKSKIKKCKHTILNKSCPYCQQLQEKWTQKLKDSGFKDHESNENDLETSTLSTYLRKQSLVGWEAKARYYQMATNFLNDYRFDKKLDQVIWEYHAEGLGARAISKILKNIKVKTNRTTVWQHIKRMQAKMFDMYMAENKEYHD